MKNCKPHKEGDWKPPTAKQRAAYRKKLRQLETRADDICNACSNATASHEVVEGILCDACYRKLYPTDTSYEVQ